MRRSSSRTICSEAESDEDDELKYEPDESLADESRFNINRLLDPTLIDMIYVCFVMVV